MASQRFHLSGLYAIGFQVMTLSNSTAVALNSTCQLGSVFHISVETNDARYRADGTAPTKTTGVLLTKALAPTWIEGAHATNSLLTFQRTTGTSKVSIMAYKRL